MVVTDTYLTIEAAAEAGSRERGSKFLAFAYMVENEADIKVRLEALKRKYHDATHHCYGWRLWWGAETGFDERTRANDDGEPSGTAGKPILNQIVATGLTNVLIVVVRYFGGTKLGVPGLTRAYKEAATEVIANCKIVER
ncbi:MAG: YigZ family protein, partial [Rikenellaceae bacterium]|nr:YigZ family protein [Rikenellaceae bacterium]